MALTQTDLIDQTTNRTFSSELIDYIHRHNNMRIGRLIMTRQIRQQIFFYYPYPVAYMFLLA